MSFDTTLPPFTASDPHASFLNATALDLLLIELVPLARRISALSPSLELPTASSSSSTTAPSSVSINSPPPSASAASLHPDSTSGATHPNHAGSGVSGGDSEQEFRRLEELGYRVGQGLVERFSRDRARCTETLDVIKFVCKDLWMVCWRKQVDGLKTNHRGVYVLTDNTFKPLTRMSTEPGGNGVVRAQPYLWFPCGIIRGALANMGVEATVHAECHELPGAVFNIKTGGKGSLV